MYQDIANPDVTRASTLRLFGPRSNRTSNQRKLSFVDVIALQYRNAFVNIVAQLEI